MRNDCNLSSNIESDKKKKTFSLSRHMIARFENLAPTKVKKQ